MAKLEIQIAKMEDLQALLSVFESSIKTAAVKDYKPKEIQEWLKSTENKTRWENLVNDQHVVVAIQSGTTVGFGSLKGLDYVDFLYVHGDFQRQGIAQRMLDELINVAKNNGAERMFSDVSKTAKPFFEKNGFRVLQENKNARGDEVLINFHMVLDLITA